MTRSECSRPDCGRTATIGDLCNAHYLRLRDGRPLDDPMEELKPAPARELIRAGYEHIRDASNWTVNEWSRSHGWPPEIVRNVYAGRLAGRKGRSRRIALALEEIGRREVGGIARPKPPPLRGGALRRHRIPEGHPSRYRILKPSRIPAWAREMAS